MRPRPTHLADDSSHPGITRRPLFSLLGLAGVIVLVMIDGPGLSGPPVAGAGNREVTYHDRAAGEVLADVGITEAYISPPDSCQFPGDGIKDFTQVHYRVIWPDTVSVGILIGVQGGADLGMIQSFQPRAPGQTASALFNGCVYQNNVGRPLADGFYQVTVRAITAEGPNENFTFPLEVDRVPPIVRSLTESSGTGVFRNGDTVVLELVADRPGYTIAPDFTILDTDLAPLLTTVADHGDGSYTIRHDISERNIAPDRRDIGIPIRITDLAGNSRTDRSTRVCLLNHPPRLVSSRILSTGNVFKNGDTVRVETAWDSPNAPLTVSADFGNIDNHYQPNLVAVTERSGNVFELAYPLSAQNTKLDYTDYRLRITAHDSGCGTATDTSIVLQLDNQPPPAPALDPVPPSTHATAITISGTAPGAARVEVKRGNTTLASTVPAADSRFTAGVALIPSLNTLVVTALDAVGNRSAPDTVRITVTAPAAPVVDQVPPSTRADSIRLTGQATNAVVVRVTRGGATVANDSSLVNGRFDVTVPLVSGRNDLKVESLNSLSEASADASLSIFRITGAFVSVPSRFQPGAGVIGQFQLGLASTGRHVRIELWNLAGDLVSVLEDDTSRDLYTLTWNGRDADGRSVEGGPLISKIDIDYIDGSKETVTKAFVLVKP